MTPKEQALRDLVEGESWEHLKSAAAAQVKYYRESALVPSDNEFDFVRRERNVAAADALESFFIRVETFVKHIGKKDDVVQDGGSIY